MKIIILSKKDEEDIRRVLDSAQFQNTTFRETLRMGAFRLVPLADASAVANLTTYAYLKQKLGL